MTTIFPPDVLVEPRSMRGRAVAFVPLPPAPPELPDGVWERDGELVCACRSCECAMPIECEPEEFDPGMAYCGGSPRCLP